MNAREPYLCLICNRVMVLRRCIPNRQGQPDMTIWSCLHCSEKQGAELAVIRDAPGTSCIRQRSTKRCGRVGPLAQIS